MLASKGQMTDLKYQKYNWFNYKGCFCLFMYSFFFKKKLSSLIFQPNWMEPKLRKKYISIQFSFFTFCPLMEIKENIFSFLSIQFFPFWKTVLKITYLIFFSLNIWENCLCKICREHKLICILSIVRMRRGHKRIWWNYSFLWILRSS